MIYDEWLFEHFGGIGLPTTGADILARKAWEAATKNTAKRCAEICRQFALVGPSYRDRAQYCLDAIKEEFEDVS